MDEKKSVLQKYGRLFGLIVAIVVAVLIVWRVFGDTLTQMLYLLHNGNSDDIQTFLEEEGSWHGMIATILLSMIQVISIFLPGFAIQIAAGILYGWWKAFLLCYCGFLLGNILVFTVSRQMGAHIKEVANISNDKKNNWIREKMKTTKPGFVVAFVNLLPILPNGIIPYIAANSTIGYLDYVGSLAVSCWLQILMNCIAGHFLIKGEYLFMVLALSFQIALVIFVALKRKTIMNFIPGQTVGQAVKQAEDAAQKTEDPETAVNNTERSAAEKADETSAVK